MDLWASFVSLLNMAVESHAGTVVAAAALAFVIWALQKLPVVKDYVAENAKLQTVVALFLAVAPGVVAALASGTSWTEALMTAVSTFLMALGAMTAKDKLVG